MSIAETQTAVPKPGPSIRWYHLTPDRVVIALLAVEVLLWLSERFDWLDWDKGYAVQTAVAAVAAALMLMAVWFAVALIFHWRFQFSIWSLLVLTVVVALPCSRVAVRMEQIRKQKETVKAFEEAGWAVNYEPLGPEWLRALVEWQAARGRGPEENPQAPD